VLDLQLPMQSVSIKTKNHSFDGDCIGSVCKMTNPHVMVTYPCISVTAIRLATQVQTSTQRGHRGRDRIVLDLQLPMQSVSIKTKAMSSNPVHGEIYSIQHCVIMLVIDMQQVGGSIHFPPAINLSYKSYFQYDGKNSTRPRKSNRKENECEYNFSYFVDI
jgi:hypothetical protein